jgi:hypothetical protein
VQDDVELVVGAVLDAYLPALLADRNDVGAREGNQVAGKLGRRG